MDSRRIYLSHPVEDTERVRPLVAVLQAAGITTLTAQPDEIPATHGFVLCFASDSGGSARYDAGELQRAVAHVRGLPGNAQWITLVKLTPCVIPSLEGIPANAPVLDLGARWAESVAQLIAPPPPRTGSSTFTLKSESVQTGGTARFTNVNQGNGASRGGDAAAEITIGTIVADGDFDLTNVRN